jgi:hypothetical protein
MVRAQADEDFARIAEKHLSSPAEEPGPCSPNVYLISFRSGKGEWFRKMLLLDKEFNPLRKSLLDAGYPILLPPSKAIVLVRPDQYLETVNSQALSARTLKRYHVVIAESEEYLMDEVLSRMSSKKRPRENKAERAEIESKSFYANFVVKRTFIVEAPMFLVANTVVQSTTEAVRSNSSIVSDSSPNRNESFSYYTHGRGGNPRRHVLGTWG